ncbi:MAG: signal peptidase II [Candidatus Eisenbacteria bacterium]
MRTPASLGAAVALLFGGGAVLLDQATKAIVTGRLGVGRSVPVAGDLFRITHVRNPGGAFGLFREQGALYTVLSIAAVALLFWIVLRGRPRTLGARAAIGLVLGGALGNLIDRLRFHRVVDFLDVGVGDLRWPVFNLADVAVVAGVAIFLLVSMRSGDPFGGEGIDSGGDDLH